MKDQRCKYKESNEIKIRMKGKLDEMTQKVSVNNLLKRHK